MHALRRLLKQSRMHLRLSPLEVPMLLLLIDIPQTLPACRPSHGTPSVPQRAFFQFLCTLLTYTAAVGALCCAIENAISVCASFPRDGPVSVSRRPDLWFSVSWERFKIWACGRSTNISWHRSSCQRIHEGAPGGGPRQMEAPVAPRSRICQSKALVTRPT